MRGAVLASVGVGCLILLLSPAASAERRLAKSGTLTATAPEGSLCRQSLQITVHAPDESAFTDNPVPLEKLVGGIRAAIGFECAGQPSPSQLTVTGKVGDAVVYQGQAEAGRQWELVGQISPAASEASSPAAVDQRQQPDQTKRQASAAGATPCVRSGLDRNQTSALQALLNDFGRSRRVSAGKPDGKCGRRTEQAIRLFQAEAGIPVDGVPSLALLDRLSQFASNASPGVPDTGRAPSPSSVASTAPLDTANPPASSAGTAPAPASPETAALLEPQPTKAPGNDCSKASSTSERMRCAEESLLRLGDTQNRAAETAVLTGLPDPPAEAPALTGLSNWPTAADFATPPDRLVWQGRYRCGRQAADSHLILLGSKAEEARQAFFILRQDQSVHTAVPIIPVIDRYTVRYDDILESLSLTFDGRLLEVGSMIRLPRQIDIVLEDEQSVAKGRLEPTCEFALKRKTYPPEVLALHSKLKTDPAFTPPRTLDESSSNDDMACLALAAWTKQVKAGAQGRDLTQRPGSDPASKMFVLSVFHDSLTQDYLGRKLSEIDRKQRDYWTTGSQWRQSIDGCMKHPLFLEDGPIYKAIFYYVLNNLHNMESDLKRIPIIEDKIGQIAQAEGKFSRDLAGLARLKTYTAPLETELAGALPQVGNAVLRPVRQTRTTIMIAALRKELDESGSNPPSLERLAALDKTILTVAAALPMEAEPAADGELRTLMSTSKDKRADIARSLLALASNEIDTIPSSLENIPVIKSKDDSNQQLIAFAPDIDKASFREKIQRKIDDSINVSLEQDIASFPKSAASLAGIAENTSQFQGLQERYASYSGHKRVKELLASLLDRRNSLLAGAEAEFVNVVRGTKVDSEDVRGQYERLITATLPLPQDKMLPAFARYRSLVDEQIARRLTEVAQLCDQLAAHPADPDKASGVAGVADDALDARPAADACATAVNELPDEPRLAFQLGRVLMLGGENDLATGFLSDAAAGGSAAALAYLGDFEDDPQNAEELYQAAVDGGFAPATAVLAELEKSRRPPAQTAEGTRCDALAAHPADPARPQDVAGVEDAALDAMPAFEACSAAVAAEPDNPRFGFEMGRTLLAMEMNTEAADRLRAAADAGSAAAAAHLADLVETDDEAVQWLQAAADGGFTPAADSLAAIAAEQVRINADAETSGGAEAFDTQGYRQPEIMAGLFLNEFGRIDIEFYNAAKFYIQHLVGAANMSCPNIDQRVVASIYQSEMGPALYDKDAMARKGWESIISQFTQLADPAQLLQDTIGSSIIESDAKSDMSTFLGRYDCDSSVDTLLKNAARYYADPKPKKSAALAALHEQRISRLFGAAIAGHCIINQRPSCSKLFSLMESDQKIISCTYGPFDDDGTGFRGYDFWYVSPPDDIDAYAVPGDDHPFYILGTKAVDECPKTAEGAHRVFETSRLE